MDEQDEYKSKFAKLNVKLNQHIEGPFGSAIQSQLGPFMLMLNTLDLLTVQAFEQNQRKFLFLQTMKHR